MPSIRQLPSGRFQVRLWLSDGKSKSKTFDTREEAEQWAQGHRQERQATDERLRLASPPFEKNENDDRDKAAVRNLISTAIAVLRLAIKRSSHAALQDLVQASEERRVERGFHLQVVRHRRDLDAASLRINQARVGQLPGRSACLVGRESVLLVLEVRVLLEGGVERLEPRDEALKLCVAGLRGSVVGVHRPLLRGVEDLTTRYGDFRAARNELG